MAAYVEALRKTPAVAATMKAPGDGDWMAASAEIYGGYVGGVQKFF